MSTGRIGLLSRASDGRVPDGSARAAAAQRAQDVLRALPQYAPTPHVRLEATARSLRLAALYCKYEGNRLGLDSFKALGATYAMHAAVARARASGGRAPQVFACASDGNHGFAVASVARRMGAESRVYLPTAVSETRADRIRSAGAVVVRVAGVYEDAQRQLRNDAARERWSVISDYSDDENDASALDCMAAYSMIAAEMVAEWQAAGVSPTHLFVPTGCGAFAAGVGFWLRHRLADRCPRLVLVEPERAACVHAALEAGTPVHVAGDLDTMMGGLACASVSRAAFPVLKAIVDHVVVIGDHSVPAAVRRFARPTGGDRPLTVGETGAAGLAALTAVVEHPELAAQLGLTARSVVVLLACEGATDPVLYEHLLSLDPAGIGARANDPSPARGHS